MRNVFDQYDQPENRLTHALASALVEDQRLLRKFVKWVAGEDAPKAKRLEIGEQSFPGEQEPADEDKAEPGSLPDAWIRYGDAWVLIIESKIGSPLTSDQLERHRRVAEQRRGFTDVHLVALVTERPRRISPEDVRVIKWTDLYTWLQRERGSEWARRLAAYMEILERKLVAEKYRIGGTLTVFAGIPFGKDCPYNYDEAKRLLTLALDALRKRSNLRRELGMDPEGKGRSQITGREASPWGVWNFLPLVQSKSERSFTKFPHLTLSIQYERVFACVTLPNRLKTKYRRNLLRGGKEGFLQEIKDTCKGLETRLRRVDGAAPWIEIVQRRYATQRSVPIVDARLEFDMRTARVGATRRSHGRRAVKSQPDWLEAVYETFSKKRSNLQITVGAIFPYSRCAAVHRQEILEHIADVWLACKPLIRKALG